MVVDAFESTWKDYALLMCIVSALMALLSAIINWYEEFLGAKIVTFTALVIVGLEGFMAVLPFGIGLYRVSQGFYWFFARIAL